ncbi:hypothetical protein ABIA96_002000 [Bradyrhizobium sp. LB11.1]
MRSIAAQSRAPESNSIHADTTVPDYAEAKSGLQRWASAPSALARPIRTARAWESRLLKELRGPPPEGRYRAPCRRAITAFTRGS